MHLTFIDFLVLFAYLSGLFILGLHFSKRQTSNESYFLGDRKVPWFLAGISVLATLLSTISYVSIPGEMIRYGIGFFSAYLALFLIVPVVNRIIIPFLMRLPVTSVYEYLEKRYNVGVRSLASLVFVLTRLLWTGLIIYTASFAIAAMTGWSIPLIILVIGVVTTFYTTTGGFKAVIWSDFAQFVILFGGAALIPFYIAFQTSTGPGVWWDTFSQAGRAKVPLFSFDPTTRITITGMILLLFTWNICTHGADQVAAQRYLSTSSLVSARRSLWMYTIGLILLIILLMMCGLALFFFNFQESNLSIAEFQAGIAPEADKLLPRFIARELPAGISGLLLAALLAAAMSSLSSAINSISSVLTTDFCRRFNLLKEYQESLILAMGMAFVAGAFGIISALFVHGLMQGGTWNLVELMERANHLFVAPLGALFFVGLFFRRVGSKAAALGFVAGVLSSVLISFSGEIFGPAHSISFMWIMPVSLVISMLTSFLLGYLLESPSESQVADFASRVEDTAR